MIEKLIVGRYIELNVSALNQKPASLNIPLPLPPVGSFVDSGLTQCFIEQSQSTGFLSKTKTSAVSQVAAPSQNKAHRNFHWLKWRPHYIMEISLTTVEVLTGPMSGCYIVIYRRLGVLSVGHISTGERNTPEAIQRNLDVKAAWNHWAQANPADVIAGFNPKHAWSEAEKTAALTSPNDGMDVIFALIAPNYTFYSVLAIRQKDNTNKYRIHGIKQCSTLGLNVLQNLPDQNP